MNKQKRLLLGRSIFVFIIFVALGVIVLTEKAGDLLIPRVQKKMNNYINDNYKDLKDTLKFKDITYKNTTYTMKVVSKKNKNHYFYIKYYGKKITDTYKKDYLEGNNILTYIQKKIKKEIESKTTTSCDIEIPQTLDKYTSIVQQKILEEDNLLQLKFFTIKKEIVIEDWDKRNITNKIIKTINIYKENDITPRSYTITITNKKDLTESIEIENLTEDFINNSSKEEIISDIINDNSTKRLKESKIRYKYLN